MLLTGTAKLVINHEGEFSGPLMRVSLELMKNALTSLAKSEEAQDLAQ